MMFYTASPALDAEAYYGYCEQQQSAWEARCMHCEICGDALDPNYDDTMFCFEDDTLYICKSCYDKQMKKIKAVLNNNIFCDILGDAMDAFYTRSPMPD